MFILLFLIRNKVYTVQTSRKYDKKLVRIDVLMYFIINKCHYNSYSSLDSNLATQYIMLV